MQSHWISIGTGIKGAGLKARHIPQLPSMPSWFEKALCAQTDPERFFPEQGGSTRDAKATCFACEVRGECLQYALDNDEKYGIWGGLSEYERRAVRRRRAA